MSKCTGPCENEMVFDGRVTMRASDLKVLELLDFRAAEGVIAFHDQRMLLYDADVLGILRRELVETVGSKVARGLLTRFGSAAGDRRAQTPKKLFRWGGRGE